MKFQKIAALSAVLVLMTALTQRAWGEPVKTIRNNGDSVNRVDLVILGDGYSVDEIDKYSSDVESFVQRLFVQEPFSEYQRYFNVHRIDVISNQTGADHPERTPPIFRDTTLGATYNCARIQRLICVNISKVNDVLSRSVPPDQREVILVIVNDTEYGGSGGAIAVASINSAVVELILHELGHSFGLLADEYTDTPPTCNNSFEPPEPNVTKETSRSLIKWNVGGEPPRGWIELSTPIPTNFGPGIPGLYRGAKYCTDGLYRPTFNSKMRSLGVPFEQINSEQLVKRVYNWASPIDSSEPVDSTVNLVSGQIQTFGVQIPQPFTHSLDVTWKVNGKIEATTEQFTFSARGAGSHTVEVLVSDPTVLVRNDPANVLKETRRWDVIVESTNIPILNDLVNFFPLTDTFQTSRDPSGCPAGHVGIFRFNAQLISRPGSPPLKNLKAKVTTLTNNNLVLNADGGPGGVGATVTVGPIDDYSDGVLTELEDVRLAFAICLTNFNSFTFFVDVLGIEASNLNNSLVMK